MLSVELDADRISALDKSIDTELMVYGRIPLLVTEACLMVGRRGIAPAANRCDITDADGANYPILRDGTSCRNVLYSARSFIWPTGLKNTARWAYGGQGWRFPQRTLWNAE
jgi:putative protease